MLGAAGRAAGGLVKQAVKAGNVSQILPASSISRKYQSRTHFLHCHQLLSQIEGVLVKISVEAAILSADGSHLASMWILKIINLRH